MPIELRELLHNLKDRAWDVHPVYQIDENEAEKIIKQLDRLDSMFVNADEIKHDDEVFNDDYADKNIQNGWIYCKDRLPKLNEWVLTVNTQGYIGKYMLVENETGKFWRDNVYDAYLELMVAWHPLPKWEVEE